MTATIRLTLDSMTLQRWGGVSRYAVGLVRALQDIGTEASVLPGVHINDYLADVPDGVWRLPAPFQIPGHRRVVRTINRTIERRVLHKYRRGGLDPIILHHTYYRGDLRPEESGVRHVITVYDMIHEEVPQHFDLENPTSERKRRDCVSASVICAISETTRTALISRFHVPSEKVVVTHPGIHPPHDYAQSRTDDFLLYVGRRDRYKDFPTLLRALAQCRIAPALVAFGGGPATPGELAEVRRLGLTQQVSFSSGDDQKLSRSYQSAILAISTSMAEGFGLPTLEAMANGCPILLADTPISREVADTAAAYFTPQSASHLAEQIERLVASSALRSELRAAGLRRSNMFTWERCARATREAYRVAEDAP